jgi:hypothetical protein
VWDGDGGAAAWLGDVVRSSACRSVLARQQAVLVTSSNLGRGTIK